MRRAAAWVIFALSAILAAWFLPYGGTAAPVLPPEDVWVSLPASEVPRAAPDVPADPEEVSHNSGRQLERWLEGTVRYEDGAPAAGAHIIVSASERADAIVFEDGDAGPDGAFRIDLTPPAGRVDVLEEVVVLIDHPDAVPRTETVMLLDEVRDRAQADVRVPLEVVLERAATVAGRVVDARGTPVRGADVLALSLRQQHMAYVELDSTLSGPDGEYRLRAPAARKCLLGAAHAGRRTAFLEWFGEGGSPADLVLEDAVSIAGRVTDVAGLPICGATVEAQRVDEHGRFHRARFRLPLERKGVRFQTWSGAWLGADGGEAQSAADGSFTLTGLEPGPHHVRVAGLEGEHVLADALEDTQRTVEAPTTGLGLRVDLARVRFEVRLDGATPPVGAFLTVESRHMRLVEERLDLPPGGTPEVLARPGGAYEVELEGLPQNFGARRVQVPEGGRSAVLRVEFERPEPRSSLLVIVSSPSGVPAQAGFGFFDPDDEQSDAPAIRRDAEAVDGQFLVSDLPPGRWRVVVRAGGPWLGGDAHFLEEAVDVELPPRGRAEARVALRTGGRIRIDARDKDRQPVDAECEILDGVGRAAPVSFQVKFESGGAVAKTGGLVPRGENLVVPVLPEGTYTLRFGGEGWVEKTETVRVRAGETTRVAVVLERTR